MPQGKYAFSIGENEVKVIKSFFYFIVFLLIAGCVGVLVCAFNPQLTASLAEFVQQNTQTEGSVPVVRPDEAGGTGGSLVIDQPGIRPDWKPDGNGGVYEPPSDNPSEPPAEVSGKTGYQPVEQETEQVPQEEADNLNSILSTGNLGSELTFPEEYYPYYAMLEEDMKLLYKQIYANASDLTASFSPVVKVDVNTLKTVFEAVCNDHPELFWMDTGYSCKYTKNGGCVEITLKFNSTADRLDAAKEEWNTQTEMILQGARELGSIEEKEEYVHNVLTRLVEYNAGADMNQSAYSALVRGQSVCAGYARAFQYCMQQLGIPCYYCTGYSGENHAWNIVKLGDVYRNVDVTWDDTDPSTKDYFNRTDAEFASTHMRTGLSVYLPACLGESSTEDTSEEPVVSTPLPTPMTWVSFKPDTGSADKDKEEAGVLDSEIMDTMEKYYKNCGEQLKKEGSGDAHFNNVIPESLWSTVEKAYSNGDYWKAYVNDVLKELKVENFTIQIQVQRLGGGYYRLYHNIYTY